MENNNQHFKENNYIEIKFATVNEIVAINPSYANQRLELQLVKSPRLAKRVELLDLLLIENQVVLTIQNSLELYQLVIHYLYSVVEINTYIVSNLLTLIKKDKFDHQLFAEVLTFPAFDINRMGQLAEMTIYDYHHKSFYILPTFLGDDYGYYYTTLEYLVKRGYAVMDGADGHYVNGQYTNDYRRVKLTAAGINYIATIYRPEFLKKPRIINLVTVCNRLVEKNQRVVELHAKQLRAPEARAEFAKRRLLSNDELRAQIDEEFAQIIGNRTASEESETE